MAYTPPSLCVGTWRLAGDSPCLNEEQRLQEEYVAEQLEISGAPVNVFKLLGVHEQGKLVDLTGNGYAISGGTASGSNAVNAFDITPTTWVSSQTGMNVLTSPAYIGYNFGTKKTAFGTEKYAPAQYVSQHITTVRIQQSSNINRRATQIRVDRSDGKVVAESPSFIGTGNGLISNVKVAANSQQDVYAIVAITPTSFSVTSSMYGAIGTVNVGEQFKTVPLSFAITAGTNPFAIGDTFYIKTSLQWTRVDIVNLPNTSALETINVRASTPSPYWRLVPIMFSGVATNEPWEVNKIELIDYMSTALDNVQDIFLQENRDRSYAKTSVQLRCQYQPFDSIGDLGKFGLNILDQYVFTVSFARMVQILGRPIVTGDILELPPEVQYDQNLNPVKKYLEVTDTGWSSQGYSPSWRPLVYRFQAEQLIPSIEHRDILGTRETTINVDDSDFLTQIQQIETTTTRATENIAQAAADAVPETGQDPQAIMSGMAQKNIDAAAPLTNTYDGRDAYIEDAMPPDGQPYGEGYKLPDMMTVADGEYFRLLYPSDTKIPARLFKFNAVKGKWMFIEQDRRGDYSSFKPSMRAVLQSQNKKSLKS